MCADRLKLVMLQDSRLLRKAYRRNAFAVDMMAGLFSGIKTLRNLKLAHCAVFG